MTWTPPFEMVAGSVSVATSSQGGHPPEFWAEQIVNRLMFVADNAPMPIREQALAFRAQMLGVVTDGIKDAIASDRAYRKRED